MTNNVDQTVWLVWPCDAAEPIPCACFSQQIHANMLSQYLESVDLPTPVQLGETDLEVDKYLPQISKMLYPFEVSMYKDGAVFEALQAGIIADPDLAYENAPLGISGVFWALDRAGAIELADEFRLEQIRLGKL